MPSPGGAPTLAAGAGAGAAPPALGLGPAVLLLLIIVSTRPSAKESIDLHHGSAEERNANHEQPARNDSENPENVTEGHSEAVLGERAVKWMEVALIKRLVLVLLGRKEISEGLHAGGGSVQALDVDVNWRRWCGDLDDPQRWGTGSPAIAEHWLVVAIEVCEIWRGWVDGPESSSLVECGLYTSAVTEASLVSSSDKNPPLLRSCACGLDA